MQSTPRTVPSPPSVAVRSLNGGKVELRMGGEHESPFISERNERRGPSAWSQPLAVLCFVQARKLELELWGLVMSFDVEMFRGSLASTISRPQSPRSRGTVSARRPRLLAEIIHAGTFKLPFRCFGGNSGLVPRHHQRNAENLR